MRYVRTPLGPSFTITRISPIPLLMCSQAQPAEQHAAVQAQNTAAHAAARAQNLLTGLRLFLPQQDYALPVNILDHDHDIEAAKMIMVLVDGTASERQLLEQLRSPDLATASAARDHLLQILHDNQLHDADVQQIVRAYTPCSTDVCLPAYAACGIRASASDASAYKRLTLLQLAPLRYTAQ